MVGRAGDDASLLDDRLVPGGGNQVGVLPFKEGGGSEDGVGVAALEKFEGLADVLAVDHFLPNELPNADVLEGLLGGQAIGGKARVG